MSTLDGKYYPSISSLASLNELFPDVGRMDSDDPIEAKIERAVRIIRRWWKIYDGARIDTFHGRCCIMAVTAQLGRRDGDLDRVTLWHPEMGHAIECCTAEEHLVSLRVEPPAAQLLSKDTLQTKHGSFGQTPAMIAALLFPPFTCCPLAIFAAAAFS